MVPPERFLGLRPIEEHGCDGRMRVEKPCDIVRDFRLRHDSGVQAADPRCRGKDIPESNAGGEDKIDSRAVLERGTVSKKVLHQRPECVARMCVVPARRNRGLTGDTAEDEDPGILPGDWFEAFSQETPSYLVP